MTILKNKITWSKDNTFHKCSYKEIEKLCFNNGQSGDIRIEKRQYGRKINYYVFRLEKVGTLTQGLDTLTRQRAVEELKRLEGKDD